MSVMYLHIRSTDDRIVHLEIKSHLAAPEAGCKVQTGDVDVDLIGDLIAQLTETELVEHPARILRDRLGRLLFTGEVGSVLREALRRGELSCVFLELDGACRDWPWELAADPETGLQPALTTGFVRRHGRLAESLKLRPQGLLVLPKNIGSARRKAVLAASRQLGRVHGLDIYAVDPSTGPGVRQSSEAGAALVHVESTQGGTAVLDDGPVPLHRLGLGEHIWLATLSGGCPAPQTLYALRESGTCLLISFRFSVPAHHNSAFFRALWKALADGDSVASATLQARFALAQLEGTSGISWASPMVISAGERQGEPALDSFPPSDCIQSKLTSPSFEDAAPSPVWGARRTIDWGRPMPAPVFVQNTLRRMMTGLAGDAERAGRAVAMRTLGGRALDEHTTRGLAGLSPAERIRMLSDKLVDAVGRADEPLRPRALLEKVDNQLSEACLLTPRCVANVVGLIQSHRMVYLCDHTGRDGVDVARRLAAQAFNYFPILHFADEHADPFAAPDFSGRDGILKAGTLYRAVAANWRRDEIDPYQPEQPGPVTRMPTVARNELGWQVYDGSWLVIDGAHRLAPAALNRLLAQLDVGQISGLGHRGPYAVPIPSDFRVILVGQWSTPVTSSGIPVIPLEPLIDCDPIAEVWLEEVNNLLGEPLDAREAKKRRTLADLLYEKLCRIMIVHQVSIRTGASILAHATLRREEANTAVVESIRTALSGEFDGLVNTDRAVVDSVLRGDDEAFWQRLGQSIELGGERVARGVAQYLGRGPNHDASYHTALSRHLYEGKSALDWYQSVSGG
ncbi:MAG: hypothetical protein VX589_20520 [Myxococcota bacterium]|nr:hypothetical protein [Myxococcota bacterium]